jgi:hypothetical protein
MARRNYSNRNRQRKSAYEIEQEKTHRIAKTEMNKMQDEAIQEGLRNLVRDYPRFASFEGFLNQHIDRYALIKKVKQLKTGMEIPPGQAYKAAELFREGLVDYVSSGEMLDEEGKEKILKTRTEPEAKKGFFYRLLHRPKTKGTKDLSKTFRAFDNIYALVKSGDYAKQMPKLEKSLRTLRGMQFYDPAIELLRDGDLIDANGEKRMRGLLESRVKEGAYAVPRIMEDYLRPAAGIFALFGVGLILAKSPGITGNTISFNNLFSNTGSLIGAGCLLLGLVLLLVTKKKKRTKRKSK